MINTPYYRYNGKEGLDKWYNTDAFREPALRFLKDGTYTSFPKGTSGYIEHWNKEKDKILNGVTVDGQSISGYHYQYLNYCPIPILGSKKSLNFPDFWDLDADWFIQLDRGKELKKHISALKARKRGFSLKDMVPIVRDLVFERDYINYLASYKDSYATKSWSFVKRYLNHINKHTGFYRTRSINTSDHIKVSYYDSQKIERGRMNELYKTVLKDDPTKGVGGNINKFIYEEAGIVPGTQLLDTLEFIKAAMEEGDFMEGLIILYGSVGELEASQSLKELFYNPGPNGFMEFDNVWEDDSIGDKKCGYFVPEFLCYRGCIDKDGNSLIDKALESINRKRLEKKKLSSKSYRIYVTQHPIKPAEAFLNTGKNRFPVDLLAKWANHLESTGEYKYGYGIKLHNDNGIIKHEILHDVYHPFSEYKSDMLKMDGVEGVIWIYEPPVTKNRTENLYIQSTDDIVQDKTTSSDSLFCTYVFKNDPGSLNIGGDNSENKQYFRDSIVASYVGRRDNSEIMYQMTQYLTEYYPGCKNLVENATVGLKNYYINNSKEFLLQEQMDEIKGINPTSKVKRDYGYHPTAAVISHGDDLYYKYLTEVIGYEYNEDGSIKKEILGYTRIRDLGLIRETIDYNPEGNFDRITAFRGILLFKEALTKREIRVLDNKNDPVAQAAAFAEKMLQRQYNRSWGNLVKIQTDKLKDFRVNQY